jgi:cobalt-zinc-cadmium efflux system protein
VPAGIDIKEVEKYFSDVPGVEAVHDLHIWGMSTTETALTAHLMKPEVENEDVLLARIRAEICDHFGIDHVTLQLERSDALIDCGNGMQNL